MLEDGVPRSTSRIAAELGLEVRSALWSCYDLARLGRVLKSVEPVGELSFEHDGRDRRLREFAYYLPQSGAEDEIVDGVRYVKLKHVRNILSSRSDSRFNGTVQMRVVRLLADEVPRSIRQIARELGLEESSIQNAMILLVKGGAVLRTEKPKVRDPVDWFQKKPRPQHLWVIAPNGEKDLVVVGERYVQDTRRNGKTTFQAIIDYVRENLRGSAKFTTSIREDLEKRLGRHISQSMIMSALKKYKNHDIYVRGYQGSHRMTPFQAGYAITWLDPDLPRDEALRQAKERTDRLLQHEETASPLFRRVHSIYDIVTDRIECASFLMKQFGEILVLVHAPYRVT